MQRQSHTDWTIWLSAVLTLLATTCAVITFINPQWIESLFDASPDAGSGESERSLTVFFVILSVVMLVITVWRWRRANPAFS